MRALARPALLALAALALSPAALAGARPTWGGLGYMTQGWVLGDLSGINDELGVDNPQNTGLLLGGGGLCILGGRVVVAGQGYGLHGLGGQGVAADMALEGGGGGLNLGYALVNARNDLVWPHVGVVGHGSDITVHNGADPARFGTVDLLPGERALLQGGGWAVDVGASMFRLFWGEEGGGMAVGGSLGWWFPVAADAYTTKSGASTGLSGVPGGAYFRVNLGGGGATRR